MASKVATTGTCGACGSTVSLTSRGKLRNHGYRMHAGAHGQKGSRSCAGANKPPLEVGPESIAAGLSRASAEIEHGERVVAEAAAPGVHYTLRNAAHAYERLGRPRLLAEKARLEKALAAWEEGSER